MQKNFQYENMQSQVPGFQAPPSYNTAPPAGLSSAPSGTGSDNAGETKVEFEPNTKTHLMALLICMLGGICCCCIPYSTDSCQSAKHTCRSCGAFVGTYKT
ncbi:GM15935 [Drosophila sechellia]|uniref:GM15935 n=1 Tax=Drosophila sechellia TaxID=7238 RepID=B4I888_DROSE|nr:GM15935 [Drosophila sechellia]